MTLTTLSKVGNSMAVLLPKALRSEACFEQDTPLVLESPRKGVVVITAIVEEGADRLARLKATESRIESRRASVASWPAGTSADGLLEAGKEERADGLLPL